MEIIDDMIKKSLAKKINKMIDEEIKQKILDAYYDFATTGVSKIKTKKRKENERKGISTKNTRPKNRIA